MAISGIVLMPSMRTTSRWTDERYFLRSYLAMNCAELIPPKRLRRTCGFPAGRRDARGNSAGVLAPRDAVSARSSSRVSRSRRDRRGARECGYRTLHDRRAPVERREGRRPKIFDLAVDHRNHLVVDGRPP